MASRFGTGIKFSDETEEQRQERIALARRFGQLKRHLYRNKPLTGKSLELALEIIEPHPKAEPSDFQDKLKVMSNKLKSEQVLDDYEIHLIVDVLMIHDLF